MAYFRIKTKKAYGGDDDYGYEGLDLHASEISIVCPDHGAFSTTPDNFLYHAGCPDCRGVHPRGYPKTIKEGYPNRSSKRGPQFQACTISIHADERGPIRMCFTWGDNHPPGALYAKQFLGKGHIAKVEKAVRDAVPMYEDNTTHPKRFGALVRTLDSVPTIPERGASKEWQSESPKFHFYISNAGDDTIKFGYMRGAVEGVAVLLSAPLPSRARCRELKARINASFPMYELDKADVCHLDAMRAIVDDYTT